MTYTHGQNHVVKHKYGVYLRNYPTTGNIGANSYYAPRLADLLPPLLYTKQQNLYRLAAACNNPAGMASIVAGAGIDGDIVTNYAWYRITTVGAAAIDLANEAIAGEIAGDVIVIEHYAGAHTFTVTDQNGAPVIADIGDIGDIAVFVYTTEWNLWFFVKTIAGDAQYYYTQIGICDEKPNVKTDIGDTKPTATEGELNVSETIEVNTTVLQVTKDNWEFLRTWSENNADVIFYDIDNVQDGIGVENVVMTAQLEVTGNDLNTVPITLKREVPNIDDIFQFTYVGT